MARVTLSYAVCQIRSPVRSSHPYRLIERWELETGARYSNGIAALYGEEPASVCHSAVTELEPGLCRGAG